MRYVFVLFVLVPLAELYLLLAISRVIGFWPTVALTLLTGMAGGYLAKREGLKAWRTFNGALARMEMPSSGLLDGVLALFGGVLLITPGVISDLVGLLALVPASRRLLAKGLRAFIRRRLSGSPNVHHFSGGHSDRDHPPRGPRPIVETTGSSRD